MPSWNIHIAIAERVLADGRVGEGCVADGNAFLFGSCVPDVYVGYMVPDAVCRINYCTTHFAEPHVIPVPDADRYWNRHVSRRLPAKPAAIGLTLGAWAHLVADHCYNGRFREFVEDRGLPVDDELRIAKQADFDLYGRTLGISSHVEVTPQLLEAAYDYAPYRILGEDVRRAVVKANGIVDERPPASSLHARYRLLDAAWMTDVLEECSERICAWLGIWHGLCDSEERFDSERIRAVLKMQKSMYLNPHSRHELQ